MMDMASIFGPDVSWLPESCYLAMQILLLAFLIYWVLRFVRLNGVYFGYFLTYVFASGIYVLAGFLHLPFVVVVMRQVLVYFLPLLGALFFQNDLRRLMVYLARGYITLSRRNTTRQLEQNRRDLVNELVKTVCALTHHESWRRFLLNEYGYTAYRDLPERSTGALIALQASMDIRRELEYSSIGQSGMGAMLSCRVEWLLLRTIFYPGSPLHDGGVIIDRSGTIIGAGCRFPAAEADHEQIAHTRHNAGLGLSIKVPDAYVIVVSEETGRVSVCANGQIVRTDSPQHLRQALCRFYGVAGDDEPQADDGAVRKLMRVVFDGNV